MDIRVLLITQAPDPNWSAIPLDGAASPATTYSPLVGAELALDAGASMMVPLRPGFQARRAGAGRCGNCGRCPLAPAMLLYLGTGRAGVPVRADIPARLLLIGGDPFAEQIVMSWNFVGRLHEDIVRFREDWAAGRAVGSVDGHGQAAVNGPRLPVAVVNAQP